MSTFDEMIGLPAEFQLGRRPLLTLGEVEETDEGSEVEEAEEPKATTAATTYHGQRAKENTFGDSGDSFISKLLASKYGADDVPSPTAAALRGDKPYQAGAK
jgi:hypothetical protein